MERNQGILKTSIKQKIPEAQGSRAAMARTTILARTPRRERFYGFGGGESGSGLPPLYRSPEGRCHRAVDARLVTRPKVHCVWCLRVVNLPGARSSSFRDKKQVQILSRRPGDASKRSTVRAFSASAT